jgi:hypothetical protein
LSEAPGTARFVETQQPSSLARFNPGDCHSSPGAVAADGSTCDKMQTRRMIRYESIITALTGAALGLP